ncbi:hypothetical protein FRC03_011696 [Tulasnella sp. 419]|nr:hypothetical protein FRC02_007822 [Tulasnella sp. 418]KAG8966558.1 hypothetical protein FRC03_011696 [Tulasnella sp. 419]
MSGLSAAVTRILTLSGFPPELKTRDIQQAFGEWENERGGFKIKWVDDTTLMLVFVDAGTAKRAYLSTILNPPPQLISATTDQATVIKPYDGPDAQAIIQNVNSRTNGRGHGSRQSMSVSNSVGSAGVHKRGQSYAGASGGSLGRSGGLNIATAASSAGIGREPSPTLPSLPSHPTLNSLINSSLGDLSPPMDLKEDTQGYSGGLSGGVSMGSGPKVGDPGRRMVGHALGIRHPNVGTKEKESMAVVAE